VLFDVYKTTFQYMLLLIHNCQKKSHAIWLLLRKIRGLPRNNTQIPITLYMVLSFFQDVYIQKNVQCFTLMKRETAESLARVSMNFKILIYLQFWCLPSYITIAI
jgi:hypothetical protein